MEEEKVKRLSTKQLQFIKVYEGSMCNISIACKKMGISRTTFYNWRENPKFDNLIKDCEEAQIDFVETKLHQKIADGDTTATIFYLKTKGKKRGYVEQVDNNLYVNPFMALMKEASQIDGE